MRLLNRALGTACAIVAMTAGGMLVPQVAIAATPDQAGHGAPVALDSSASAMMGKVVMLPPGVLPGAQVGVQPNYNIQWGLVSWLQFNRVETADLAYQAAAAALIFQLAPPPFDALGALAAAGLAAQAGIANNHGVCIAINEFGYIAQYTGGYCR